ncbi:MAG: lamin tail domain-containing protein, partial [Planctomycetales bacterium]|nr:lamin tail domain-containing protein [Planctomycetales bacterium]
MHRSVGGFRGRNSLKSVRGKRRNDRLRLSGNGLHGMELLEPRQVLAAVPIISEILALNDRTIQDQDGDDSDYIELYNAGEDDMSLNRFYLTDDPKDLQKWRFPDVQLNAGEYLVVFASNKDRNDPANELHTNFRLSSTSEYLALVEPDGVTVADALAPGYPQQVQDVSYGVPTGMERASIIGPGTTARVFVPTTGDLDQQEPNVVAGTWLDPAFDDAGAGWFDAELGAGFVQPNTPVVIADSVADYSGEQNKNNWTYGTWTRNFDTDGVYSPSEMLLINSERFFVPATNTWDLGLDGAAPHSELTATGGHTASAAVGFFSHWVIRRWTAETTGEISIQGTLANTDPSGDGVIGHILVNGTEIYQQAVNGSSVEYNVTTTVQVGDVIDFAIDPGAADDEVGDQADFTAVINGIPLRVLPEVPVADSSTDWVRAQQGANGWSYGSYELSSDPDGIYQADNFALFPLGAWNGSRWQDPNVSTNIRSTSQDGTVSGNTIQWAVRRWESNVDGSLVVEYDVRKALSGGDGATTRLFHNGVEVDTVQIGGDDTTGVTRRVTISNVKLGDLIDFVTDPLGLDQTVREGTSDRVTMDVRIARIADLSESIKSDIGAAMRNVGSSAYVRIPFDVADVGMLDELTLYMKYDD